MALNMHVILWSPCLRSAVVLGQCTDKMRDHHSALHAQISVIPCEQNNWNGASRHLANWRLIKTYGDRWFLLKMP